MTPDNYICDICGLSQEGYFNNAQPVTRGKCCDKCNVTKVIPARLLMLQEKNR